MICSFSWKSQKKDVGEKRARAKTKRAWECDKSLDFGDIVFQRSTARRELNECEMNMKGESDGFGEEEQRHPLVSLEDCWRARAIAEPSSTPKLFRLSLSLFLSELIQYSCAYIILCPIGAWFDCVCLIRIFIIIINIIIFIGTVSLALQQRPRISWERKKKINIIKRKILLKRWYSITQMAHNSVVPFEPRQQ